MVLEGQGAVHVATAQDLAGVARRELYRGGRQESGSEFF